MKQISVIHFVLDSFRHYKPDDEVDDFVRGLVGKRVLLQPDDNCEVDANCIEGYFGGVPCCHVSARKAPLLRELMRQMHRRSLVVEVKSHNLDQGFKTCYCEVVPEVELTSDFMTEHLRSYQEWQYTGRANVTARRHRLLLANTDYLLERLGAEDATEEELLPVIEVYLRELPSAFSYEDRENCIQVNILLQNSPLEGVRAQNKRLVEVKSYLNYPEQRTQMVREWLDELKSSSVCRREAQALTAEELAVRRQNLRDFPENLYDCYQNDFDTFCGNLMYNRIPSWEQQQFVNGLAVCELAAERMEGASVAHSQADTALLNRLLRYVERADWQRPATCENVKAFVEKLFCEKAFRDFFRGGKAGQETDRVEVSMANLLGYLMRYQLLVGGQQKISQAVFGSPDQVNNINKGKNGNASQAFQDLEPLLDKYRTTLLK